MARLAVETGGKSYKTFKYSLDNDERPSIDYEDNKIVWRSYGETEHFTNYYSLEARARELLVVNENLLTYFLDGTRRVYKVDDIAYNFSSNRTAMYPVVAGQIGVACTKRIERNLTPAKIEHELVISLPDIADSDGINGYFYALTQKLNDLTVINKAHVKISTIIPYSTTQNNISFIEKGIACIQEHMIKHEKAMVAALVRQGKLNQDNYLVKDGSLEYRPTPEDRNNPRKLMNFRQNYNWVIGVSKSFNPNLCLDANGRANPKFIADLPYLHRTPAAKYSNPEWFGDTEFAVWYVRIRPKERTKTAFDGIVKVEKMLVKEKELNHGMDSDDVNTISANIINMRMPVCYGSDSRWTNHLYPIFLTEEYLKSKYLSTEAFLHLF